MFLKNFNVGCFLNFIFMQELLEHRRIKDAKANPKSDSNENDREREWNSPAPSVELIARHLAEREDCKIGQE